MKKQANKIARLARRREQIKQGYFDGRFASRVEKNRKKHRSKYACRNNK